MLLLATIVALALASDVVVLTGKTFDEKTKGKDTFIKFYAPWCGHCKALAPTWDKAATELKDKAQFAKVDCTQDEALCGEFEVQGYPTLIFQTKDGKLSEYNGGRSVAEFEKFAANPSTGGPAKRTKSAPAAAAADDEADDAERPTAVLALNSATFAASLKNKKAMVEFYAPWCGFCKKLAPVWDELSLELQAEGIVTAKVDCTDASNYLLCKEFNVRGYPTLFFVDVDGEAYAPGEDVERDVASLGKFARSGASSGKLLVKPFMLRTGIAFLDSNWPMFRDDMITLYNFKKAALAVTFGVGVLIGMLLVVLFGPSKKNNASSSSAAAKKNN